MEDLQHGVDPDRLAVRRAHVGLDRVPEAAVWVAIGAERLDDRLGSGLLEQAREAVALEQPGVGVDEGLGGLEVDGHAASVAATRPARLERNGPLAGGPGPRRQQRGRRDAGEAARLAREVRLVGVAGVEREPSRVGWRCAARARGSAGSGGCAAASSARTRPRPRTAGAAAARRCPGARRSPRRARGGRARRRARSSRHGFCASTLSVGRSATASAIAAPSAPQTSSSGTDRSSSSDAGIPSAAPGGADPEPDAERGPGRGRHRGLGRRPGHDQPGAGPDDVHAGVGQDPPRGPCAFAGPQTGHVRAGGLELVVHAISVRADLSQLRLGREVREPPPRRSLALFAPIRCIKRQGPAERGRIPAALPSRSLRQTRRGLRDDRAPLRHEPRPRPAVEEVVEGQRQLVPHRPQRARAAQYGGPSGSSSSGRPSARARTAGASVP